MKLRRTALLSAALLSLGAALFAGCGGSSTPPVGSGETGTLKITLVSPPDVKYLPPSAKSIKAYVFPAGDLATIQASGSVDLPSYSGITLNNVPAGPKDIRVSAFDGLGASGNVVAYGVCQLLLLGGRDNEAIVNLM